MSLPPHSFNAVAEAGGTAPSRQEQLEASLEALISLGGLGFDMFPGGSPDKRHLAPQVRHHDAHHHTTTPSSQHWADPSSHHDCTSPVSHCGHACSSGQSRYVQALKNAVLLLSAQSMQAGAGASCHSSPQIPVPPLDFEAGSNASSTPLTPGDPYSSNSLDDYNFSNSFQFLDFEPGFADTTLDYYTSNTPKQQPSPPPMIADTIAVATGPVPSPPPMTTTDDNASSRPRNKRPRISTDMDSASPRPSPSQSPSPRDTQKPHRPHAAVEKRYRVSLNDKIEALRVCLESRKRPKRRQASTVDDGSTTDGGAATAESPGGPTAAGPSARMSKAEVLTEAVEYVQQLEQENGIMLEQIEALVERMQATQRALQLPSFTAGRT